jgi:pimeloyl-ACP methyl ester carboxylesterase
MENKLSAQRPPAAFPFENRYVTVQGHKIRYVEQGVGTPVLFVHGNPTSSYLWRNILPAVAVTARKRAIALDLLGFGQSDKPRVDYSVGLHYSILEGFIDQLKLKDIILVLHDWGGPLGGLYAVRNPERVKAVAIMETFWWAPRWKEFDKKFRRSFKLLRSPLGYVMIQVLNVFVNELLPKAVMHKEHMSEEVMRRYREPFPTIRSRKAVRAFPRLIPFDGAPRESFELLKELEGGLGSMHFPALLIQAFPGLLVSPERVRWLKEKLPSLSVAQFGRGLHFIQEDDPDKISALIVQWIQTKKL